MGYASGGGFRTLGAGLRGLGQRYSEIERVRAQDERQRMLDDERRAQQALTEELLFVDRGGGVGPAPTMERTIGAPMEGLETPDFLPKPRSIGDNLLPPPELGGKFDAGVTLEAPDPRYQTVGRGHVMKPGVREDQRLLETEAALRSGFRGIPDMEPGMADALSTLGARGMPIGNLVPDPNARSRDDWLRASGIDPATNQPFVRPGVDDRSRPTYGQALEIVQDMYWVQGSGTEGGPPLSYQIPEREMIELAQKLSATGDMSILPDLSDPHELRKRANVPRAMAGYSPESIAGVSAQRTSTATLPRPGSPETLPAPSLGDSISAGPGQGTMRPDTIATEEVTAIRDRLAGKDPQRQRELLRAAGYSEVEISQVLGGR
ncbi:MAG: hypothetical protein AB7T31_18265 [Gemmatimonadales bacterium]